MTGSVFVTLRDHGDFAGVKWPVRVNEPRKKLSLCHRSATTAKLWGSMIDLFPLAMFDGRLHYSQIKVKASKADWEELQNTIILRTRSIHILR